MAVVRQRLLGAVESVGARMTLYLARLLQPAGQPGGGLGGHGHDLSVHPVFTEDGMSGNFAQGYATGSTGSQRTSRRR